MNKMKGCDYGYKNLEMIINTEYNVKEKHFYVKVIDKPRKTIMNENKSRE